MRFDPALVAGVLSPAQIRSVVEARARINVWDGSVRSGKTVASLLAWLIYVATAPPGDLVISGKTKDTIYRNVIGPLQDHRLFGPLAGQTVYTPGANVAHILGRRVHVVGAHDAKAEGRIRGMTAAGAYVDEATLVPREFWIQLLARLSVAGARLFATTNPDNPNHWLRRDFLLRAGALNLAHWHFTLDDNPSLDPAYVASLKAEYTGLWFKRFILGQWIAAEGAVYEAWDPDRHVVEELPRILRWLAMGIDYGTANPFAALLLGLGADHRLYFAREYRHDSKHARRQLTDEQYSRNLRAWLDAGPGRPEWICIDPSAASFRVQLFTDGVTNVTPADNEVADGIRVVSSLIAADRLRVHSSCHGWTEEVTGYAWDDKAAERGEDKPIKVADHSLDGGRYAIKTTEALWRPYVRPELADTA